jgi:hypothetical protein
MLALGASTVAVLVAVVAAAAHYAMPKAYAPQLVSAVLLTAASYVPARRGLVVAATASAAVVVGLAAGGWGYSLGPSATAKLVARAHPDFGRPVRCRRDRNERTVFGVAYLCTWPGSRDGMLVRVDGATIEEYQ